MKKIFLFISLLGVFQVASAEVYSCGDGCYTSSPRKGGRANLGHKIGTYTSVAVTPRQRETPEVAAQQTPVVQQAHSVAKAQPVAYRAAPARTAAAAPAPAPTPTVAAPQMSSARASGRRSILEQELNNERAALAAAQQALVNGRAVNGQADANYQARVRQLESAVLDRQQNVQALQRELSRM